MAPKRTARFEYRLSPNNRQWYWRLRGMNGKIICQSEGYTRESNCLKGIAAVKKLAADAEVVKTL